MKKSILMLLFSALFTIILNAQELKNTGAFYKTTTNILTAINTFDEVNNGNLEKETAILKIDKNLNAIKLMFETLKVKYPKDEDFKEFEGWVSGIIKSLEFMKKDEPTYAFMCSLIKLNIYDFVNAKY